MMPWGWTSPAQRFGMSAMRYLRDTGTTTRSLAEIAVAHRYHASLNPKAVMRHPITIEDHQNSRWVVKPLRLLDCCLETDVLGCLIVTSRERAYDLRQPPVFIMGGTGRTMAPNAAWNYSRPGDPLRRRKLRSQSFVRHGRNWSKRREPYLVLRRVYVHHPHSA